MIRMSVKSIVDLLESQVPWIEVSSAHDGMEALELLERAQSRRLRCSTS
jgi:hypothetical protein